MTVIVTPQIVANPDRFCADSKVSLPTLELALFSNSFREDLISVGTIGWKIDEPLGVILPIPSPFEAIFCMPHTLLPCSNPYHPNIHYKHKQSLSEQWFMIYFIHRYFVAYSGTSQNSETGAESDDLLFPIEEVVENAGIENVNCKCESGNVRSNYRIQGPLLK